MGDRIRACRWHHVFLGLSIIGVGALFAVSTLMVHEDIPQLAALRKTGAVIAAIGAAYIVLALLASVGGGVERHRIARSLRRFGSPAQVAAEIGAEAKSGPKLKAGQLTITRSRLLVYDFANLRVGRIEDLVWVYGSIVTISHSGAKQRVCRIHLCSSDPGFGSPELVTSEEQNDAIMEVIHARAPWLTFGYSDEMQHLWKKQRAALIAQVQQQRDANRG